MKLIAVGILWILSLALPASATVVQDYVTLTARPLEQDKQFLVGLVTDRNPSNDPFKPGAITSNSGQLKVRVMDFSGPKLEDYVYGVELAEVGSLGMPDEALRAIAIAIRTYSHGLASNVQKTSFARWDLIDYQTEKRVTPVNAIDTDAFQTYVDPEPLEKNSLAIKVKNAVDATRDLVMEDEHKSMLSADYFSSTRYTGSISRLFSGYTRNYEEGTSTEGSYGGIPINGQSENFVSYIRENISSDSGGAGGHGRGLPQMGAANIALNFLEDANFILNHYYGPNPPFVRAFEVEQEGQLKFRYEWIDHPGPDGFTRDKHIVSNQAVDLNKGAVLRWYLSSASIPKGRRFPLMT